MAFAVTLFFVGFGGSVRNNGDPVRVGGLVTMLAVSIPRSFLGFTLGRVFRDGSYTFGRWLRVLSASKNGDGCSVWWSAMGNYLV